MDKSKDRNIDRSLLMLIMAFDVSIWGPRYLRRDKWRRLCAFHLWGCVHATSLMLIMAFAVSIWGPRYLRHVK